MQTLEKEAIETRRRHALSPRGANRWLVAAVVVLAAGVLALGAALVLGGSSEDPLTEAELEEMFSEYGASLMAADSERWIAQWTEDGVQLVPNAPANVGKAAILAGSEANMAVSNVLAFDISNEELQSFGDLAYARGTYLATIQMKAGGAPFRIDGKYLTVFQRQPDGSWLMHRDAFNSNTPPPSAQSPASPADAVAPVVEAWNAQDAEAFRALYHPEVQYIYDASRVGAGWANIDVTGREAVLESFASTWAQWSPTITSYEVTSVDGATVTTEEFAQQFGTGPMFRQIVTYEVTADGLVLREEHIVQP